MVVPSLHAFASHNWGPDAGTHARVKRVVEALRQAPGVDVWFDEDDMRGDIIDDMTKGIDVSDCMIVFVTSAYMKKAASGDRRDNVRLEFSYAASTMGAHRFIAVRFDPDLPRRWTGSVGAALGNALYVDMSFLAASEALDGPQDAARFAVAVAALRQKICDCGPRGRKALDVAVGRARAVRALASAYGVPVASAPKGASPGSRKLTSVASEPALPSTPHAASGGATSDGAASGGATSDGATSDGARIPVRERVARVSTALGLSPAAHMSEVLDRALRTMGVSVETDAPFGDRLRLVERELQGI